MSEFTDFYSEAVKKCNNSQGTNTGRKKDSAQGKIIRCRFCLSEAHIYEPSSVVHCEKCGNSFSVTEGTAYSIDLDSVKKMSGKQLYDAAFYDGKIIMPFLELAAKKQSLEALLLLASYWESRGDEKKAEAYFREISEKGPEGKAAYILYRFRHDPPLSEYGDLLVELDKCRMNPFYVVDPGKCADTFYEREKQYIQYCKDDYSRQLEAENERITKEFEQQHHFTEKDEYVDDDFYEKYYLPYINGQKTDDGADWNGMPWSADHANAAGV